MHESFEIQNGNKKQEKIAFISFLGRRTVSQNSQCIPEPANFVVCSSILEAFLFVYWRQYEECCWLSEPMEIKRFHAFNTNRPRTNSLFIILANHELCTHFMCRIKNTFDYIFKHRNHTALNH